MISAASADVLTSAGVLALLALLPFVVVVATSFAKVAVVLGIVRSAFGAPGVPPASVVTGLAVVITFFVMAPVARDIMERTTVPAASDAEKGDDRRVFADALAVYDAASPPLLDFLRANTTREEINHYQKLAREDAKQPAGARVLLMAFASSEFVEAVTVGFLVLLPFVLIDLLVAHVLLATGMMNLPAAVVALPLKLLLFIAADGWRLITDALVMSYRV